MPLRILAFAFAALLACGDDASPTPDASTDDTGSDAGEYEIPAGCNPLAAEWDCKLPFPSDAFLVDDATMPTGRRVALEGAGAAIYRRMPVDVLAVNTPDGFSVAAPAVAWFPFEIDDSSLVPHHGDPSRTTEGDSPTLLIDSTTGERIVHFAELDPTQLDPTERALLIRPLVRLEHERRYVVAIRNLRTTSGDSVPAPEGFRQIRDDDASHPTLQAEAARYATEVFPLLDSAGVDRATLNLAWDFTTGSEERVTQDMLDVRAAIAAAPPGEVRTVEIIDDPEELAESAEHVAFRLEGMLTVPLFLDDSSPERSHLNRDEDGRVVANGTVEVPFVLIVPKSVAEREAGTTPARFVQYGHGFFGGRAETHNDFVGKLADDYELVIGAVDWWGMTRADQEVLAGRLAAAEDLDNALRFTDRVHQGMANALAFAAARESIAALPELQFGGEPAFATEEMYFYGISQGHILGGTYASLSPDIPRFVLGVGGANFSLIMFRSRAFLAFRLLIDTNIPEQVDRQTFASQLQLILDRIDPLTYAPHVLAEPFEGAQPRQIMMQVGVADAAVSTLAAQLHARTVGIPAIEPATRTPPLLDTAMAPVPSGLVEYDLGFEERLDAEAPEENGVHEAVRRLPAAQRQLDAFFRPDGMVTQTCSGACDPE